MRYLFVFVSQGLVKQTESQPRKQESFLRTAGKVQLKCLNTSYLLIFTWKFDAEFDEEVIFVKWDDFYLTFFASAKATVRSDLEYQARLDFFTAQICPSDSDESENDFASHYAIHCQAWPEGLA